MIVVSYFWLQELEQQLQSEGEIAQEQTEHLQSLLDEEKRLKEEANHDVLKTREVYHSTRVVYNTTGKRQYHTRDTQCYTKFIHYHTRGTQFHTRCARYYTRGRQNHTRGRQYHTRDKQCYTRDKQCYTRDKNTTRISQDARFLFCVIFQITNTNLIL